MKSSTLIGVSALSAVILTTSMVQASNIRIATFNTSLSPNSQNTLIETLSFTPSDPEYNTDPFVIQARQIAEVIQRIDPDIILLNEFNYNPDNPTLAATLFQQNFLSIGQNISGNPAANPINFTEFFVRPSLTTNPFNTGIASGFDLDNNGEIVTIPETEGYGGDAWGFGNYPGQYGMIVYSKYPILEEKTRTFQNFLWQDMPNNLLDEITGTNADDWYSPDEAAAFPLSSKSHWDLPIDVKGEIIHLLASHPTPPVFDGDEDRNGRRNYDEIRLWNDYITPNQGNYIYDDNNIFGGLAQGAKFLIVGDQNADPNDGDSRDQAINQLLNNPLINTSQTPSSQGGIEYPDRDFSHTGNPAYDTAAFTGGLRVDYALPSSNLGIINAEVFWPTPTSEFESLNNASDHHAVIVEVNTQAVPEPSTFWGLLITTIGGYFVKKRKNFIE